MQLDPSRQQSPFRTRSLKKISGQMLALKPSAIQISHPFVFDEDPGVAVIRVIGRGDPLPDDCDAVIVDESHGQGKTFDLSYARDVVQTCQNPGNTCWRTHPGKCGRCHPAGASVCRRCCKRYRDSTGYQRSYKNCCIHCGSTEGVT